MNDDNLQRAVFLDRDGVLNRVVLLDATPHSPATLAELTIAPDAPQALAALKSAGYFLAVVTNQPDVSRGLQSRSVVEAMHVHLRATLPLDAVYVCYESDDNCPRRKPHPGMLLEAAAEHRLDLPASFMIGDRWRDVEAGRRAGCRTLFLDGNYDEPKPQPPADWTGTTLWDAARWILVETRLLKEFGFLRTT